MCVSTDDEVFVPSTAAEVHALLRQAADLVVVVDGDAACQWSSDGSVRVSLPLAEVFVREDAAAVQSLLADAPTGPAWARVRGEGTTSRWVSVVASPRVEGGWILLLRAVRGLDSAQPEHMVASGDAAGGAADRDQVLDEVAWLLSATPRTGKEIAVVACDLDDLSFVNEEFGREAGDEVLRIVTGRISDALRSGDLVARIEDDQFLVVLRGVHHLRGAIRVANKIRAAVEDPISLPVGDIVQTVSVGVTLISRGESVDSVLERAETAMRLAKTTGRNVVMSSPPI